MTWRSLAQHPAVTALITPLAWVILLSMEVAFFVDAKPTNIFLRLFEDLVFVTSFLFYSSNGLLGYLQRPVTQVFISFTMQFMFWWLTSLGFILIKRKLKKTSV